MSKQQSRDFVFGNCTDVGKVRERNEDYMGFFENQNGAFFIVCDGMGGHSGGDIAAQLAVNSIREFYDTQYYEEVSESIYQAIQFANQRIYEYGQSQLHLQGMGTTCVLMMIRDGYIYHGHVGDSRLYHHSLKQIRPLTKDHSFVQALVDQGVISEEDALTHPRRNELLRALGTQPFVDVTVSESPFRPEKGEMFLLCTDGLTGLVSDGGIEQILNLETDVQSKALQLVDLANTLGGIDNTTVQLIEFTRNASSGGGKQASSRASSSGDTSFGSTQPQSFPRPKKSPRDSQPENIDPISETVYDRRRDKMSDIVTVSNTDLFSYQPILTRAFVILVIIVAGYLLYKNTVGRSPLFAIGGSGNIASDSTRALEVEARWYEYFWNSNTKLKKAKEKFDRSKEKLKELNDKRKKTFQAIKKFFKNKEVRHIANTLKEKQETLQDIASKYNSEIIWILRANGVNSEAELLDLDTLAIPLEPPTLPEAEAENQEESESKE